MAAYGKTITSGVFWNVNLHTCFPSLSCSLWLSYTAPQMERTQQRELCGLLVNGVCRLLSWWVMLPFFTLLVQGHLPYTSTLAQLLPSYYACSSVTLLTAPDTVEKSQMTNFIQLKRLLLDWKQYEVRFITFRMDIYLNHVIFLDEWCYQQHIIHHAGQHIVLFIQQLCSLQRSVSDWQPERSHQSCWGADL